MTHIPYVRIRSVLACTRHIDVRLPLVYIDIGLFRGHILSLQWYLQNHSRILCNPSSLELIARQLDHPSDFACIARKKILAYCKDISSTLQSKCRSCLWYPWRCYCYIGTVYSLKMVHRVQAGHQNNFLDMSHIEHRYFLQDNRCKQQDDRHQHQRVHQHQSHRFYDMLNHLDMDMVDNRLVYHFVHHHKIHQDIVHSYHQLYYVHIDKHLNIDLDKK